MSGSTKKMVGACQKDRKVDVNVRIPNSKYRRSNGRNRKTIWQAAQ